MQMPEISGRVVAVDATVDEFMTGFGEGRHEYVEGVVIRMSPNEIRHSRIERYVYGLLEEFFARVPIGEAVPDGPVLKLAAYPNRRRRPDGAVILTGNSATAEGAVISGSPDIVLEIVSDDSQTRDEEDKFVEYQTAGISEYWLINPLTERATFYRLTNGVYVEHAAAPSGYSTPLLPRFVLDTATLWKHPLPTASQIGRMVDAMLADAPEGGSDADV